MHKYLPQSENQTEYILEQIGKATVDELFAGIPAGIRENTGAKLPKPKSEIEIRRDLQARKSQNKFNSSTRNLTGGGLYNHYIPSVIDPLVGRGEFLTAYTSYQPEVSQGTLQAIFEYQSMLCELTGMDICNASLYDAPTAIVEGIFMACRVARKNTIIIAGNINPEYKQVLETYAGSGIFEHHYWEAFTEDGILDLSPNAWQSEFKRWKDHSGNNGSPVNQSSLEEFQKGIASFVVQSPNFWGRIEDYSDLINNFSHILVQHVVPNALSLGLLKSPGNQGAAIVTGEAQAFGIAPNFGGPLLGIFGTKKEYMRQIPGRLVGKAKDIEGQEGYLITLATREQHIRREKATSNICTNQGLMVIRACIYLSLLGKEGVKEVAEDCHALAVYLAESIGEKSSCQVAFKGPIFNELTIKFGDSKARTDFVNRAKEAGFSPGIELNDSHLIVACTELLTKADIDEYVSLLS